MSGGSEAIASLAAQMQALNEQMQQLQQDNKQLVKKAQTQASHIQNLNQSLQQAQNEAQQARNEAQNAQSQATQAQAQAATAVGQAQAAAVSNATKSLKLEHVDKYDGNPEYLSTFIFKIEEYAESKNWLGSNAIPDGQKIAARYASSRFGPKCVTWYRTYVRKHQGIQQGWDDLKAELEVQFQDPDHKRRFIHKFNNVYQGKQSIVEYNQRFQHLVIELDNSLTDDIILERYIAGLRHSIRKQVLIDHSITTLSDAQIVAERVYAAETYDRNLQQHSVGHRNSQATSSRGANHNGPAPMQVDNVNASKNWKGKGKKQSFNGNCHFCGKFGHMAKDCFKRKTGQQKPKVNAVSATDSQPQQESDESEIENSKN